LKSIAIYVTDNFIRFGQAKIDANKQLSVKEDEINIASLKAEDRPLALRKFLQESKIVPEYITLAIPRTQVSIRYLNLPAVNDNEIRKMVEYDLNNLFPFKAEELIYDYAVISKSSGGYSRVMLVAVQREIMSKHISLLKKAGLVPDGINISAISLFNQFYAQNKSPDSCLVINLDDAFADMILISGQKPVFSRGVSFKGKIEKGDFIKTVDSTLTILKDKGFLIDKIILSGRCPNLDDFAGGLQEAVAYQVGVDRKITVIKGLVLKKENDLKLNLLPLEVRIEKSKAKRKRALIYFITLILLNLSLAANVVFLKMKSKEEYLGLLKAENKKIDARASGLQKKMLKIQILRSYLDSGRLKLSLLSELYRLAPDGITLSSLDISGNKSSGTIVLIGQAKDTQAVLKFANSLKASGSINKADVNYMTKRKLASEETVDFEIRAAF